MSAGEGQKEVVKKHNSFTLVELMIAVAIFVIALSAILASYANMFILADIARDLSRASNAVRARMEEVKQEEFDSLDSLDGTIFNLDGFAASEARGRIEVRAVTGINGLREVRIVGCFRSRARIVGEDLNLDGILDIAGGEDQNNNGRLDSPVEFITLLAD